MTAVRIHVEQRSPAWLAARRELITATDIPAILGLSPYRSEAHVAADKAGELVVDETIRMRIGSALEPLILGEYERVTGNEAQRFRGMYRHGTIAWAGCSPDARTRYGARRLIELKWSGNRSRFRDELPTDVEAQVRWQLGVLGWDVADVAALSGDDLHVYTVEHDEARWRELVDIADDFRRRMAAGGPFDHNADSVKRTYQVDDGSELVADAELAEAVTRLLALRSEMARLKEASELVETAVKARMADAAVLVGPGFRVTWKTQSRTAADWQAIANAALGRLSEAERADLIAANTRTTTARYFKPVAQEA